MLVSEFTRLCSYSEEAEGRQYQLLVDFRIDISIFQNLKQKVYICILTKSLKWNPSSIYPKFYNMEVKFGYQEYTHRTYIYTKGSAPSTFGFP